MELDLKYGVVYVMEELWVQLGLAMGSGMAAGAATLYTAWLEDKFVRSLSLRRLTIYKEYVLALRWMDDRWVIVVE